MQKLNEQVNFMTLALYEQVKALQEQGRNQDAVTVITRAAADETVMALARVRASQNPVIRDSRTMGRGHEGVVGDAGERGPRAAAQMQQLLAENQRELEKLNNLASGTQRGRRWPGIPLPWLRWRSRSGPVGEDQGVGRRPDQERKDAVKAAQDASADYVQQQDAIIEAQATKEQKKKK